MPLTQTGIFCQQTDLPLTVVQMNVVYRKNNLFVHYIACASTAPILSQYTESCPQMKLVESFRKRIIEQLDPCRHYWFADRPTPARASPWIGIIRKDENEYQPCEPFRYTRPTPNSVSSVPRKRTARRYDPLLRCLRVVLSRPKRKSNRYIRPADIDAHPILRTSFELQIFIDVRSQ